MKKRPHKTQPTLDELKSLTVECDGCWVWKKARLTSGGYGVMTINYKVTRVHRLAYELATGSSPGALHVLHRCDNPPCINPAHLFLGTNQDNIADRVAKGRTNPWNKSLTHCKRGHAFTPSNTRTWKGHRTCRKCARLFYEKTYKQHLIKAKAWKRRWRSMKRFLRGDFVFSPVYEF